MYKELFFSIQCPKFTFINTIIRPKFSCGNCFARRGVTFIEISEHTIIWSGNQHALYFCMMHASCTTDSGRIGIAMLRGFFPVVWHGDVCDVALIHPKVSFGAVGNVTQRAKSTFAMIKMDFGSQTTIPKITRRIVICSCFITVSLISFICCSLYKRRLCLRRSDSWSEQITFSWNLVFTQGTGEVIVYIYSSSCITHP